MLIIGCSCALGDKPTSEIAHIACHSCSFTSIRGLADEDCNAQARHAVLEMRVMAVVDSK